MRQPLGLTVSMARYMLTRKLKGERRYPLVLMLEPLFQCNLRCVGCGKVRQPEAVMNRRLSKEECLEAVDECGAPVVSIAGGEPLILPYMPDVVRGCIDRGKLTLLCTNGLLFDRVLEKIEPHPYFLPVFHIDGLREHHDAVAKKAGVFDAVFEGIRKAKEAGFKVATNTTLFGNTRAEDAAELFGRLMDAGVDCSIVSPAFAYEELDGEGEDFLGRREAQALFRKIDELTGDIRFYNSPMYIEFLKGNREYQCTPWGNPTRDPLGWKGPCYLLTDGHYRTFRELMEQTDWDRYGYGKNPRCAGCSMHSGYEATAVANMGVQDMLPMIRWMLR